MSGLVSNKEMGGWGLRVSIATPLETVKDEVWDVMLKYDKTKLEKEAYWSNEEEARKAWYARRERK